MKPGFINPGLLEDQNISLDRLLEGEAAGMAFPLDAKYFDDFPLIYNEPALGPSDKAGRQYPQPRGEIPGHKSIPPLASLRPWWVVP